jgi:hypothetical protein
MVQAFISLRILPLIAVAKKNLSKTSFGLCYRDLILIPKMARMELMKVMANAQYTVPMM